MITYETKLKERQAAVLDIWRNVSGMEAWTKEVATYVLQKEAEAYKLGSASAMHGAFVTANGHIDKELIAHGLIPSSND